MNFRRNALQCGLLRAGSALVMVICLSACPSQGKQSAGAGDAAALTNSHQCVLPPCPPGNQVNPATCRCEPIDSSVSSNRCTIPPCPPGNQVNPTTCRCEPVAPGGDY